MNRNLRPAYQWPNRGSIHHVGATRPFLLRFQTLARGGRYLLRMLAMTTNVTAHITGTVWKIEKQVGDSVQEGDTLVIIESMKMEMPVEAPCAGTIRQIACSEGQAVEEGALLAVLD